MAARLMICLLVLGLVACDKNASTRAEPSKAGSAAVEPAGSAEQAEGFDLEREKSRIDTRILDPVELPGIPYDTVDTPEAGFLLVIEPGRIRLSHRPVLLDWVAEARQPPESRDAFEDATEEILEFLEEAQVELALEPEVVMTLEDGEISEKDLRGGEQSFFVSPLYDALSEAVKEYKRAARLLGKPVEARATLVVDRDTPWASFTRILYTAGQAEIAGFQFVVTRRGNVERMTLVSPQISLAKQPSGPAGECARLVVNLYAEGSYLVAREGLHGQVVVDTTGRFGQSGDKDGDARKQRETPDWSDAVLVEADAACPTAESGDGEGEALRRVAGKFEAAELCRSQQDGGGETRVLVAAAPEVTVGRVVQLMSAIRSTDAVDGVTAGLPPDSSGTRQIRCGRTFVVGK